PPRRTAAGRSVDAPPWHRRGEGNGRGVAGSCEAVRSAAVGVAGGRRLPPAARELEGAGARRRAEGRGRAAGAGGGEDGGTGRGGGCWRGAPGKWCARPRSGSGRGKCPRSSPPTSTREPPPQCGT